MLNNNRQRRRQQHRRPYNRMENHHHRYHQSIQMVKRCRSFVRDRLYPSVIYHHHHHMYYVNNGHITNGCTMSSPTSSPATQPLIGNHFIDNNGLTPIQSRLTIPIGSIYQPTSWLIEPLNHHQHFESCSKINNNINNGNNNNSNSNKLESSPKSPATSSTCSSSGGTSSYFASNSSGGSSRHSPFTVSLSSSSSSTSSTPSVSLSPDSTCEQTDDTTRNEMDKNENIKSVNESMIKVSSSSSSLSNYSGPGSVQHQTLTAALKSTLTPSILANSSTPLLSGSSTTSGGTGMERVWMSEFRRIFSAFYNELWSIQPVERKPNGIKLHMFVDSAKVRFCCDRCGHSWTSMKGRIVFWFNLLPPNFNTGIVTIKLFGQKCETCKIEVYEQPMWYPEEVTKVLMNLFNRVGQIFYGFEKTKFEKQRRMGKTTNAT
ncbi:Zinc-binding domain [Blomia tropicalis]|nr:Zinc-binding domain [Blomia tropicalis]